MGSWNGFAAAAVAAVIAATSLTFMFYVAAPYSFGLMAMQTLQSSIAAPRCSGCKQHVSVKSPVNAASFLYSTAGHEHLPPEHLNDERLAPLTRWAQSYIYEHQFVADCSKARILISDGYISGFGSEIHLIGAMLGYAIENNFTMVLSPNTCSSFTNGSTCDKGCGCLFRPISNCEYGDAIISNPIRPNIFGYTNLSSKVPRVFQSALLSVVPSMTRGQIKYWWRAQSAAFLMRFNEETIRKVARLRHIRSMHYFTGGSALPFPLPPGTIAAHIRGGDKVQEMKLVKPAKFIEAATDLIKLMPNSFSSRAIFVSADDESAIRECRFLAEQRRLPFAYTHLHRQAGGHKLGEWRRQGDLEAKFHGHLLQLLMSLEADAWIGTRRSNWNRLIDELRCVWVDKCPNIYVEVGSQALGTYSW